MEGIYFDVVFPLVLLACLLFLILRGISKKYPEQEYMTKSEFMKDWLKDHGQAHKLDEQFEKMQKDPAGKIYMPLTYKGAKIFMKMGLTPNQVSIVNLILSFFIFYGVIIAVRGQSLDLYSQQPFYGWLFIPLALLVFFTGIVDGIDGAIARLRNIKTRRGGWFDNVIDRISDTLMLVCFVPGTISIVMGLDFRWVVWTNIILIFLYEYMRARHEGLGLKETKPFMGERITRILTMGTFFLIYGISSFGVMITFLIDPPSAETLWAVTHGGVTAWVMIIMQLSLLLIMVFSCLKLANYSYKGLKELDNKE
ncbi:MAG: CDP-alcohol phosphatidyltransferase family protein [Candidatus Lokiarchaeota archaeon]|nr:CDP-alcohol phosphatidyltransferase family protein [Candidatus Lokiarchaeota archaeon]